MDGKVVMITGAGSGFGAETSVLFASKGCRLALVDKGSMESTLKRCVQAGLNQDHVLMIQADLAVTEDIKTIPQRAVDYFGRLDVLVNNAGTGGYGSIATTEDAEYEAVMNLNCKTVFFLSQHAMPHLIKTKGNIVNVSSVFGFRPRVKSTTYCISKSAVNQITECAALEFAPQQVRVNAVNPGHSKTSFFSSAGIPEDKIDTYLNELVELYPFGRIAEPVEIAKAIVFLADDTQASFITGVCLPVDGGFRLGNSRK